MSLWREMMALDEEIIKKTREKLSKWKPLTEPNMTEKYDTSAYRNLPGLLPDHLIRELIGIEPFAEGIKREGVISYGLTSIGYDTRLGRKFKVFNNTFGGILDPKKPDPKCFIDIEDADYCLIPPHGYILGESLETFELPRDIGCIVVGKSTYARNGIVVNVTPGEPEWRGKWTIEIFNPAPCPAKVYAGEGIMQILFFRTVTDCETSYADKKGKYQDQSGLMLGKVDGIEVTTEGGFKTRIQGEDKRNVWPCQTCGKLQLFVVPNHGGLPRGVLVCHECGKPSEIKATHTTK